jgi:hypothetical protein
VKFRNKEQYIKTHPHHLHPNQTHGMQAQIRKKNKWKRRRETFFSTLIICNVKCHQHRASRCKDVCAIFIDVSKAFDKVWHEGLIFKLRQFGITDTLISLLENYLTDRSRRVVLNGKTSPSQSISAGVPHRSILELCYFKSMLMT